MSFSIYSQFWLGKSKNNPSRILWQSTKADSLDVYHWDKPPTGKLLNSTCYLPLTGLVSDATFNARQKQKVVNKLNANHRNISEQKLPPALCLTKQPASFGQLKPALDDPECFIYLFIFLRKSSTQQKMFPHRKKVGSAGRVSALAPNKEYVEIMWE